MDSGADASKEALLATNSQAARLFIVFIFSVVPKYGYLLEIALLFSCSVTVTAPSKFKTLLQLSKQALS